tara:strand:+ start:117 stop:383 length:267 start_codon:yes stop_codon:yes gene_type:complete
MSFSEYPPKTDYLNPPIFQYCGNKIESRGRCLVPLRYEIHTQGSFTKKKFNDNSNFSIVADFDVGKKGPPQGNPRPLIQIGNGFVQSS